MSREKIPPMITDSNQACMAKMIGRRVQEEVNGGATTGKWDRMKVAAQSEKIKLCMKITKFRKSLARSELVSPGAIKWIASA
jgi:hypothetical protein